jgi:ABC-type transport system substrate-binding protein
VTDVSYWSKQHGHRWSRRNVLRTAGVGGAGLAGAALIGCGDDDPEPAAPAAGTPSTAATPAPAAPTGDDRFGGQFFGLTTSPQENFNQVANWQEANNLSGIHVYDRPFSPRPDERIYVLEAAESVELADDTTLVLRLKEGLIYQDRAPVNGRPVDAQDIVELHEFVLRTDRVHNPLFQQVVMDSVEATDDRTAVFHLKQPSAYLFTNAQLGFAANALIPRELVLGDFDQAEPVGSGPYQLKSYQFGVRYDYERSPSFREAPLPYIDERAVLAMTDASAIEAAFRGEQVHVWRPPSEIADRLTRDLGDQLEVTEFLSFVAYAWNLSSKRDYFDDERVREAFYRMFEPQEYIELVAGGRAVPVPGHLPASFTPYQLDWDEQLEDGQTVREHKRHDIEAARQLLDAAGFDFDRTYELSTITGAINETGLQVWEQQIARAGIRNVRYHVRPAGEWLSEVTTTGNFDFVVIQHSAEDTPQRRLRLHHTEPQVTHQAFNIGDPEIDALIEASEQEMNFEAHVEYAKAAQRLLLQRYAHRAPVYTPQDRELMWGYVRDWEFNAATHPMHRAEAWLDV